MHRANYHAAIVVNLNSIYFLICLVTVVTPQQKIQGIGPGFEAPSAGPVGNVGPLGGDGSMVQTQPPAPSPAQPQSGPPSVSQPGPQQATQNQGGQPGAPPAPSSSK